MEEAAGGSSSSGLFRRPAFLTTRNNLFSVLRLWAAGLALVTESGRTINYLYWETKYHTAVNTSNCPLFSVRPLTFGQANAKGLGI